LYRRLVSVVVNVNEVGSASPGASGSIRNRWAARTGYPTQAQAVGLENRFGTVETGKTADLVVVNGDPLEDVRVVGSRAAAPFVDGRLIVADGSLQLEPLIMKEERQ
jgi:cytosine/adenosine deaminase-related metal-dependent hydrolase